MVNRFCQRWNDSGIQLWVTKPNTIFRLISLGNNYCRIILYQDVKKIQEVFS